MISVVDFDLTWIRIRAFLGVYSFNASQKGKNAQKLTVNLEVDLSPLDQ